MYKIDAAHLRVIKTISETKNLTKAARKLFISQPALSRQLQEIEERLETDLFVRTKKSMILTKAGERLLETAEVVLRELDKAERDISKLVYGERGVIKIGVNCLFSYQWVPSILCQYQKIYPNIEIEIGNSQRVIKEILSKEFDLIITGYLINQENIGAIPLFEDDIVVIAPKTHPWHTKKYVTEKDLQGIRIISIFDQPYDILYQYLKNSGAEPKAFMKIDQPGAVIELVRNGLGVSAFPRWAVEKHLDEGVLSAYALSTTGTRMQWNAVYLRQTKLPKYQMDLLDLIVAGAAAKELVTLI